MKEKENDTDNAIKKRRKLNAAFMQRNRESQTPLERNMNSARRQTLRAYRTNEKVQDILTNTQNRQSERLV